MPNAIARLAALFAAFAALATPALADPPASPSLAPSAGVEALLPSMDGSYYWFEATVNHPVLVDHVVLDSDGYTIFDKAGETIQVPLLTNNLFLVQFAPATGSQMVFENVGANPVLSLPKGAYVAMPPYDARLADNPMAVEQSGARWYPFGSGFAPASPLFMAPAPTWGAYINSHWFPNMLIQGGFYTDRPIARGVTASPTPSVVFRVNGNIYRSWAGFESYCMLNPGPDGYRRFGHLGK